MKAGCQTCRAKVDRYLHRGAASLDLSDVAWVIEHGSRVDASHLPAERSVAHRVDLARAYSYVARDDDALAQLLDAEQVAPQIVRHSAGVRNTVKTLHRRTRHNADKTSPLLYGEHVWPLAEPSNRRTPANCPGPRSSAPLSRTAESGSN